MDLARYPLWSLNTGPLWVAHGTQCFDPEVISERHWIFSSNSRTQSLCVTFTCLPKKRALKTKTIALVYSLSQFIFLSCAVEDASLGLIEQSEEAETTNVKTITGNHLVKIP